MVDPRSDTDLHYIIIITITALSDLIFIACCGPCRRSLLDLVWQLIDDKFVHFDQQRHHCPLIRSCNRPTAMFNNASE